MWMSTTPTQRETACYAGHGTRPSHLLGMRPSLWAQAPGSLSQGTNRQEFVSPVLALVESFPGAMSPPRSTELYEPTYCQTLHPSYKSQGDRVSASHSKAGITFLRYMPAKTRHSARPQKGIPG